MHTYATDASDRARAPVYIAILAVLIALAVHYALGKAMVQLPWWASPPSVMGIYGVLSYSVTERLPEIGIRMALGESAAAVRRNVVGRTIRLALTGVSIGATVALVGTRMIASLLYGVEPTDAVTFVTMISLLLFVAFVSGLIPAIRASRTDSAQALRSAT